MKVTEGMKELEILKKERKERKAIMLNVCKLV